MKMNNVYRALVAAAIAFAAVAAVPVAAAFADADYAALERSDPLLAAADSQLNDAYQNLYALESEQGKKALRTDERNWIRLRNARSQAAGQVGSPGFINTLLIQTQARAETLVQRTAELRRELIWHARAKAASAAMATIASPARSPVSAPAQDSTPQTVSLPAPREAIPPPETESSQKPVAEPPPPATGSRIRQSGVSRTAAIPRTSPTTTQRPGKLASPSASDTLETIAWSVFGTFAALGTIGAIQGFRGRIVVYANYTDAAVATLGFWGGLLTWLAIVIVGYIAKSEVAWDLGPYGFGAVLISSLVLAARTSLSSNDSLGAAILSMAAKLLVSLVFMLYFAIYVTASPNRRKGDNESDVAYMLRIQREEESSKQTRMMVAAAAAVTGYFVHHLTRDQRLVPWGKYVKG